MTDRARELVEFLRGHHIWCTARDGRFKLAADFIEQSLTPPEGDTVSEGVVERVRLAIGNAGRETFVNSLGYCVMRGTLVVDPETTKEQADALLREAAERAIIAAPQSRVSPQAGMREALEVARRALSAVLGFPKGAALSENALDLCEQAFVGIDAALQSPSTD